MMRYLCETNSFVIGQLLIKRYSMKPSDIFENQQVGNSRIKLGQSYTLNIGDIFNLSLGAERKTSDRRIVSIKKDGRSYESV
jgi:hypothetical protein